MKQTTRKVGGAALFAAALGLASIGQAQDFTLEVSGDELLQRLRDGGYVLVMNHAQADRTVPVEGDLNQGEDSAVPGFHELDEEGRQEAAAVGDALAGYQIPIGEVISSPAQEAVDTARLADVGEFSTERRLDNEPGDAWLRDKVAEVPEAGTNRLLITHQPVILRAFPDISPAPDASEVLVFHPEGQDGLGPVLVSRITVDDWGDLI